MLWLFAQVWVWLIVALLLGVLAGWLFWARPLHRELADLDRRDHDRPDHDRPDQDRADHDARTA